MLDPNCVIVTSDACGPSVKRATQLDGEENNLLAVTASANPVSSPVGAVTRLADSTDVRRRSTGRSADLPVATSAPRQPASEPRLTTAPHDLPAKGASP
jgi:hypothetical protein